MKGTIIKGIGGFYYVETSDLIYECKAKGRFRKSGHTPMVGDEVLVLPGSREGEDVIREILPRINEFVRPPVANVEVSIIVAAAAEPAPVFSFIDRLIVMAEKKETEVLLVFNKCDLMEEEDRERIRRIYRNTGYELVFVSTITGEGIDTLKRLAAHKKCMLAGASGVGKSSIANALGEFRMETGEISRKTRRGRHTTRHVELLSADGGIRIFDTPGFTSYEMQDVTAEELRYLYPEFEEYEGDCRFNGCMHLAEPDCAVKKAVEEGKISAERYDSYGKIYAELKERRSY
ncbi:MAG: ribosome small subunit-dependent GTPase A [Firmicutes bacterium]|nr:ribosome small subunit-dependent GTPase A [Bacillota bacterium]